MKKDKITSLLKEGVENCVYPGAVLLVAQGGETIFLKHAGFRSIIPHVLPMEKDTIFDLASLTKPLSTTIALMFLVDNGIVHLDQPLIHLLPVESSGDKGKITPRMLLNHSAGLAHWKPFYMDIVKYATSDRKRLLREWILEQPLVYAPTKKSLYSDLGFVLLEWIIESATHMAMDSFLEKHLYGPLSLKKTFLFTHRFQAQFNRNVFAATENCPWRKQVLQGDVHDENAYALGGYSGHAGLFGIAEEIYAIANILREHYYGKREDFFKPETVRTFFVRQSLVCNSTWALGWDTPSADSSSAGNCFSQNSVGHLGFTGTSIWIDLDKDVVVIFLTNRIHPTRNNKKIKEMRPRLHNLIMEELGFG